MMNKILGGRYQLGAMIGTGGMADVYIAQDQRLSREVAVKILRSDLAKDPTFVSRFRKEAKAAAGLNHPGVVAVYDSGEEPAPYIVMELVSGHTLRELIHGGERLPLDRALEIGAGALLLAKSGVDGVYNAFRDDAGLKLECEQGRDMGFDGKTVIHPAQLEIANAAFAPSADELDLARRQIAAFSAAKAAGQGVAVVDGKIVENLHIVTAEAMLAKASQIAAMA